MTVNSKASQALADSSAPVDKPQESERIVSLPNTAVVIDALARECYRIADEHGFHKTPNPIPQSLCLIHSEVSEALEAYRDDDVAVRYDERGKPEGLIVELADALIRILDTAHEIQPGALGEAVRAKMAYNETRIPGHGRVRL